MTSPGISSRITPFLWYDRAAEDAAKFYTGIFRNSKIGKVARYGKGAPMPEGTAMTVAFELDGQPFTALNAGPQFKFTEAISFVVNCADQKEVDYYWDKLTASGGKPVQCGWLKDPYGLSWQIVPAVLGELASGKNGGRVMQALMQMVKLDIAALQKAAEG